MTRPWAPLGAVRVHERPAVGAVVVLHRGVWKVTDVELLPLNDDDRDEWLERGMPDLDTWRRRPYQLVLEYLGGLVPAGFDPADTANEVTLPVHPRDDEPEWHVYPSGRWARCSCCGHPMPCPDELRDRAVNASLLLLELHTLKQPGCCWGCGEPITRRQKYVTYPGDNLDLPGGMEVRFHRKYGEHGCSDRAERYELRWIAGDPRRERILTWPDCPGALAVHADGSSECTTAEHMLGSCTEGPPDCRGHLTHNHNYLYACIRDGDCYRSCSPTNHPGTRHTPRPNRATQATLPLTSPQPTTPKAAGQ